MLARTARSIQPPVAAPHHSYSALSPLRSAAAFAPSPRRRQAREVEDEEERLRRDGLSGARERAATAGLGSAEASVAEAEAALRRRQDEVQARQKAVDDKTR